MRGNVSTRRSLARNRWRSQMEFGSEGRQGNRRQGQRRLPWNGYAVTKLAMRLSPLVMFSVLVA